MSRSKYRFSLDEITSRLESPDDSTLLSDGSRGASAIVASADMPPPVDLDSEDLKKYNSAWRKVFRESRGSLLAFRLIVKNGNAKRRSVWQMIPFRKQLRLVRTALKRIAGRLKAQGVASMSVEETSCGRWSVKCSRPANGEPQSVSTGITVGDFFACSDA
jgi:hypothetical protein